MVVGICVMNARQNILNYDCINYTEEIENKMIDDEIEYEENKLKENNINE